MKTKSDSHVATLKMLFRSQLINILNKLFKEISIHIL